MMTFIWETILHNTEGGSDKLYRISVFQDVDETFSVYCDSCRRGNAWVSQGVKIAQATEAQAMEKAAKVQSSKTAKGYYIENVHTPGDRKLAPAPVFHGTTAPDFPAPVMTENRPQLLNTIDEAEAKRLLKKDGWLMQEKKDGVRQMLFRKELGPVQASNKLGRTVPAAADVVYDIPDFNFLIDGELVGSTYYVFDLLELDKVDLRPMGYGYRFGILKALMKGTLPGYKKLGNYRRILVETWETDTPVGSRLAVMEGLKARGAEGIVLKKADAPFKAGRPNTGGDQLKFKFVSTASFIVTRQNEQRSVALVLLNGEGEIPVGNCTIPANKTIPPVGAVVEIRYLYAYQGGSIYQPVYLGERSDILREECKLGQLKFKGEGTDLEEE